MASSKPLKTASLSIEQGLWRQGYRAIAGIDEAGRGTWAGPVSAGVVCLPPDRADLPKALEGVRDSKQLTARARSRLVERIQRTALAWGIGWADNGEIDRLGIVPATCLAMDRALEQACQQAAGFAPDYLLLDSIHWRELPEKKLPYQILIHGDGLSLSIAAGSVLAKVARDELMLKLDKDYPQYGFAAHKGYGTAQHRAALAEHGLTPLHRRSFAPMSGMTPTETNA